MAKKKQINGVPTIELLASGHRACAGCGAALIARHTLKAAGKNTIVVNATGCLEVFTTPYPETSWKVPWIHGAFENAAAIASGIDTALRLKKQRNKVNLIVMGGDGGTFDIGFQTISGAFERGHKFTYICYDNEAYMNTGVQRSGATPRFADTTTTPAGRKIHGKTQFSKPMPLIMAAHGAYVATANIAFVQDYIKKVQTALAFDGPSYIQVFSFCPTGWKYPSHMGIQVAKLAYETGIWPMYEIKDGLLSFTQKPSELKPVDDYLKQQGRFKHLTKAEIKIMQNHVTDNWNKLLKLEETKVRLY